MNNRWGKQVQSKGSLRSSGQNNINININFNAAKDKPNPFNGKKVDNYFQINNQPKQNLSRPNVSMQTLKQKKKRNATKQQIPIDYQLQQRKSKSKITNDVFTPQKILKERQTGNSKSIGKKSTKKRSAKSFDNLKKYYGKQSPRHYQKYQQVSQSRQNSKQNSRSKSKSRSKSNKKLIKDSSKSKIQTTLTNTRVKNSSHNSKKEQQQQKSNIQKARKISKVSQKANKIIDGSQTPGQNSVLNKKVSMQRIGRKKSKQEQSKKQLKIKTPRKRSKSKQSKSLKRLPLFYEQEQQVFNEDNNYKKIQKQAHNLLYQQNTNFKKTHKQRKQPEIKKSQNEYSKYRKNNHNEQDFLKLMECATTIQKMWRGYRVRSQFINELNMLNHKIQITRNKIANLDPKFWDDAQSNSILKAQDAESVKSSSVISELKSDMQKPISQQSSVSKDKMSKNRVIEFSSQHQQMLQRILKLEQNLKKYQVKAQQLQQENKQLKTNLQKVSINSALNSGIQSMEESLKTQKSWNGKLKYQQDPFIEQQKQKEQFELRLPKKVVINQLPKQIKSKQHELPQNIQDQQENKNDLFKKYKNKVQKYECSSPKFTAKVNINSGLLDLFQKKQDQIRQSFEKKVTIYDRMLNDNIFSPRTYTLKKNQLQQKFRLQAENVKRKKEEVVRVAEYIKQIEEQQPKLQKQKPKQQKKQNHPAVILQQNHIIEDYGNINLNSHRSKQSQEGDQFQQSLQSEKSSKQSIFKKKQQKKQAQNLQQHLQIQSRNRDAIRIFQQVSQYHKSQSNSQNQKISHQSQVEASSSQPENSSQVSLEKPNKQPKGLETTLLFIRQYCTSFIQFIQGSQSHKTTFIQGICTPIVYDSFQFLRSYRTTVAHQNETSYNSQQKQYIYPYFKFIYPRTQVITREAFTQFNEDYNKLQGQCFYQAERQFFLNSLLDAFNQSIDYKRPCSIYGEPPAWISQFRALKNHALRNQDLLQKQSFIESQKFNQICGSAIARVIEWATSLCGFIPESPQMQNVVIQQQQINHIRQTRIALMLEKDLLQSEQSILDSAIQQTEVKLQLSQLFANYLIQQLAGQLVKFSK